MSENPELINKMDVYLHYWVGQWYSNLQKFIDLGHPILKNTKSFSLHEYIKVSLCVFGHKQKYFPLPEYILYKHKRFDCVYLNQYGYLCVAIEIDKTVLMNSIRKLSGLTGNFTKIIISFGSSRQLTKERLAICKINNIHHINLSYNQFTKLNFSPPAIDC